MSIRLIIKPDYPTLSHEAAGMIGSDVQTKPDLRIGLPAGRTPAGMYEELVRMHRESHLSLSRVRTFNLDEYEGLPEDHPGSFHSYMRAQLFDHVNVPPANIHFPDSGYDRTIADAGGMDLLILGIGTNGHIAFNEPGSSFASRTRIVDLAPETPGPVRRGITMGIATILDARKIVLLASGEAKRDVIRRALHGQVTEALPASVLQLHPDVTVILDQAASPE